MCRAWRRSGCHPASVAILLLLTSILLISCGGVPDQSTTTRLAASPNVAQPITLADAPSLGVEPLAMPKVSRPSRSRGTFGPPGSSAHTTARISRSTGKFNDTQSKIPGCPDPPPSNDRPRRGPVYPLLSPSWSCVYVGETLQFSFAATGSPTWSVNGAVGGDATVGTISVTGLYTAPAAVPMPATVNVTVATASGSAAAYVTVLSTQPKMRFFTVTAGGSGTDYTDIYDAYGNPIHIETDEFVFSEIIPSELRWVVHDRHTSVEYAQSSVWTFRQDRQVFELFDWETQCRLASVYNPDFSPLTQILLVPPMSDSPHGCDPDHIGILGTSVYWKVPLYNDPLFGWYGGQYRLDVGSTSKILLGRDDPDNKASADLVDDGTLYAVTHSSEYALLAVHTRDLETGKLAQQLRMYDTTSLEPVYDNWSFRIDNSYLFVVWRRVSDGAIQLLYTDLTVPNDDLYVLSTFTTTTYAYGWRWGVHNYRAVFTFHQPGANNASIIADVDLVQGTTDYWSLGDSTDIYDIVPVYN